MNSMYNEAIKNRYLDTIENEGTQTTTKYLFFKSEPIESLLGMDLYNFSIDNIKEVLKNVNTKSIENMMTNGSFIRNYINWSILNGYREDNMNPLEGYGKEWYAQFIDKNIKQFISKTELDEIVSELVNYQDKIIPVLLFHGVYGTESSEIRNLKLSDIREDGTVRLYDDKKGERFITLDEEVINMLKEAAHETVYQHKNGQSTEARWAKTELFDSEYIVKVVKRGKGSQGMRVSQAIVIKRIDMISEYFDLPDLTPKSINRSGMLYYASKLIGDKDKLSQDDFAVIGDRFNLSKMESNGHAYYNASYLGGYINKENIDDLYGNK